MYAYQRDSIYTAQAGDGLEELLAAELTELGAENSVPGFRFVRFRADFETLCRIVHRSRLATRILTPLRSTRLWPSWPSSPPWSSAAAAWASPSCA